MRFTRAANNRVILLPRVKIKMVLADSVTRIQHPLPERENSSSEQVIHKSGFRKLDVAIRIERRRTLLHGAGYALSAIEEMLEMRRRNINHGRTQPFLGNV